MTNNVTNNEAAGRYELTVDDRLVGVAEYVSNGEIIDFTHTEISHALRGGGLGTVLVDAALQDVRRRALMVLPHCSFVRDHIAEHTDAYLELVPADRRAEFGLPAA
jgi:hypothetical protein